MVEQCDFKASPLGYTGGTRKGGLLPGIELGKVVSVREMGLSQESGDGNVVAAVGTPMNSRCACADP